MKCPFLREARVKYCQASAFRKMIVESACDAVHERCSTPAYLQCPAARSRIAERPAAGRCPFLQDATVEYCGGSPVTKFVPANDGLSSCCNSDAHLYCELFLSAADPRRERRPAAAGVTKPAGGGRLIVVVDGIPVPAHLAYAPNHMWLDVAEDGRCHVGVDAFLTSVVGALDAIGFVKPALGAGRPVAVLKVNGVDLTMAFPQELEDVVPNGYLRTHPGKVTADPYGAGWLFEGVEPALRGAPVGSSARAGLLAGESAARWMFAESNRLSDFAHELVGQASADGTRLMADGGKVEPGLALELGRDALINLFNEFFAPHLTWRRPW
ncbi:MAG TPA: hypothetical protein VMT19_13520 [Thermoanaerobaculaceae bacterium]|nr:hypothetical protein [Thermoanaerobaculaceae bacterium]